MPLDRDHMTAASRIMLPTYVVFFLVVGLGTMLTSRDRLLQTPMFRYADRVMALHAWGGLFVACGLLMLAALWLRRRMLYRYGLLVCGLSMVVWAGVAVVGIWYEPISYTAWAWPALTAAACAASNRSLQRNEQDQRRREG